MRILDKDPRSTPRNLGVHSQEDQNAKLFDNMHTDSVN